MSLVKQAFKNSIPALLCYFPLGIVYGTLFKQQGFPPLLAPLFSMFVFAGAQQFLALTLVAAKCSLLTLCLAVAPLGIRNIIYGISMFERYKKFPLLSRSYLAFGLVDATFSLLQMGPQFEEKQDHRYCLLLTFWIHLYWILGTFAGIWVDHLVTLPPGLEFALTAFFAASSVEQFRKTRDARPIWIALLAGACALWIAPQSVFLVSVAIAFAASLALPLQPERAV